MTNDAHATTTLGNYLLTRLQQLGVLSVLGVPGDFNMGFLDLIEEHDTVSWVGNCNELNAAYAADGYARTATSDGGSRCAALVTTFGVGELSALNGVAGSFSERIPVVHIVGVPSTSAQGQKALLHHTLGDGRFDAFESMSRKISIALAKLEDYKNDGAAATAVLDRVLTACMREARPVYVSLPTDMVHEKVPRAALDTLLDTSVGENDVDAEKSCLDILLDRINKASDPVILVDACAIRHGVVRETHDLIEASGFPVFSTPMGKSAVDETHPQFGGVYVGSNTVPEIKERVERADLLIQIGSLLSDFNTASFSYRTPRSATVALHSNRIESGFATFEGVRMKALLPKLSVALRSKRDERLAATKATLPAFDNRMPGNNAGVTAVTQDYLWPRIGRFLRSGDQVLAETGTSSFGALAIRLPANRLPSFHSQVLWGSIGWSLPACLGVCLATREEAKANKSDPRVALFIGDGSFQLTAQEVSTMVREGLAPIIFVLSNDGYEIERQIHGPSRRYNNTARWNLRSFLSTFDDVNKTSDIDAAKGDGEVNDEMEQSHARDPTASKVRYDCVRTQDELDALLNDDAYTHGVGSGTLRLVEVIMMRGDAPKALLGQAAATQKSNKY